MAGVISPVREDMRAAMAGTLGVAIARWSPAKSATTVLPIGVPGIRLSDGARVEGNGIDVIDDLPSITGDDGLFTQGTEAAVSRPNTEKLKDAPVDIADFDVGTGEIIELQRDERRIIQLGPNLEAITTPVRLLLDAPHNNVGLIVRGRGYNQSAIAKSSGFDATGLTGPGPAMILDRPAPSAINNNSPIVLEDFAISNAAPATAMGATHFGGSANSLEHRRLFSRFAAGHAFAIDHGYTSAYEHCFAFGAYGNGFHITNAFNNAPVRNSRAFACGRSWTNVNQGNMLLLQDGVNNENYAPLIADVDLSYPGFIAWAFGAGLTSITVDGGGIATVTTGTAHGRATGDKIALRRSGYAGLDTIYPATITVTGPSTFTYDTGADGDGAAATGAPITTGGCVIGPWSCGGLVTGVHGGRFPGIYVEDALGHAYSFSQCVATTVTGGFILHGDVLIGSCKNFTIGGVKFQGGSRLITAEDNHRAEINVLSSNVFADTSVWMRGSYYMIDGQRFGPAIPTTGTWRVGEVLFRSNATQGGPAAWVCVVAGTPGTWCPVGIVDAVQAAGLSAGSSAADIVAALKAAKLAS